MTAKERMKQMKVLFAEDEELPRTSIGNFLRRQVGSLYVAENGKEGLELFSVHLPEVVITDLEMPLMGGVEMIRRIRDLNETVPIIITTGYDDEIHRSELADRTLIKPIIFGNLLATIESCIEEHYGAE